MADTLATLARLRRLESETAKRALAEATVALQTAKDAVAAAEAAIAGEAQIDDSPGAFAAWLPRAQRNLAALRAAAAEAEQRHQAARKAFAESRVAENAMENFLDQQETKRRALEARRAEHALSDLYRPRAGK
jgi:flagellar biosynthesis chaperone FliJ